MMTTKPLTSYGIALAALLSSSTAQATTVRVHPDQLASTVSAAAPGDIVEIEPGIYSDYQLVLSGSGTASAPVRVTGLDQVTFDGLSSFQMLGNYVYLEDVDFNQVEVPSVIASDYWAIVRLGNRLTETACIGCRLISSTFYRPAVPTSAGDDETSTGNFWRYEFVGVYGRDVKVIRNHFEGRRHRAPVVRVYFHSSDQGNSIYKNTFLDNINDSDGETNGGEQIVVGKPPESHTPTGDWVARNHFAGAFGDAEIISIKASDVAVYDNVIENSCGAISLRRGHNNLVRRNIYLGKGFSGGSNLCSAYPNGTVKLKYNYPEGIVLSGTGHQIDENHIQLVGAGVTVRYGEDCTDATYEPVEDLQLLNNSIIDATTGFDFAWQQNGKCGLTSIPPSNVNMYRNLNLYRVEMRPGWDDISGTATSSGNYQQSQQQLWYSPDGSQIQSCGDANDFLCGPSDVVASIYGMTQDNNLWLEKTPRFSIP